MTFDPVPAPTVDASSSPVEALATLRAEQAEFAVVMDAGRPQAVISESQLLELPPNRRLIDLDLPPLLATELRDFERDIVGLSLLVAKSPATAILVLEDDRPAGVLPRALIRDSLELAQISDWRERSTLYGDPVVPLPTFVCRRCAPPSRLRPRHPDPPPTCPREPSHGPMERESP